MDRDCDAPVTHKDTRGFVYCARHAAQRATRPGERCTKLPVRMLKVGGRSPWGKIQHCDVIAPGIEVCDTASHGGIKLSHERNAKIHPVWRRAGGWYEEDCEVAIVQFTFREAFPASKYLAPAIATLKDYWPDAYTEVTGSPVAPAESYALREALRAVAQGKRPNDGAASYLVLAKLAWVRSDGDLDLTDAGKAAYDRIFNVAAECR
jgi:hypothetical protein